MRVDDGVLPGRATMPSDYCFCLEEVSLDVYRYTNTLTFVFFFQAEDGIRDDLVDGVQTCALPISVCTAQQGGSKEVGIVDFAANGGERIAEASRTTFGPIELVENVLCCTQSHVQAPRIAAVVICVEERVCDERRADQVGRPRGDDNRARLPGKAVTP